MSIQQENLQEILKPWQPDITVLKTLGKGQRTQIANKIARQQNITDSQLKKQLEQQLKNIANQEIQELTNEDIENLSRESLTQRYNKGQKGLPKPLLDWINQETAERLNQNTPFSVKPVENIEFQKRIEDQAGKIAANYYFSKDKVSLGGTHGNVAKINREYAFPVHAHELVHKSNLEAILENPKATRNAAKEALRGAENQVSEYSDFEVPKVSQTLLTGETIRRIYQRDRDMSFRQIAEKLQEPEYSEENGYIINDVAEELNLENLIVRDEVMAFTVTYWAQDIFEYEQAFYNDLNTIKSHYNNKTSYPDEAGTKIVESLENIREEYLEAQDQGLNPLDHVLDEREEYLLSS